MTEPAIFLELFSGTKTMTDTAKEFGFKTFSIDIDDSLSPSLCADILKLDAAAIIEHCGGRPQVIWASPDCTQFSYARGSKNEFSKARRHEPMSPDVEHAIELINHTLDLIAELCPKYWFMENPFHGALKDQIVVRNYPFVDVYYCAYDWPYQKRTRIWGAFPPSWKALTTCSHTKHDNIKGYGNARLRSEIPVLLSRSICAACIIGQISGWPQRTSLEDYE
jgi:hypothetical protein|tara:strand:+ start:242 stop:907 length:666 start_codon:yes stop_codon:yes gene_type:complete